MATRDTMKLLNDDDDSPRAKPNSVAAAEQPEELPARRVL